jgi:hypothetical protein
LYLYPLNLAKEKGRIRDLGEMLESQITVVVVVLIGGLPKQKTGHDTARAGLPS